MIKKILIGTFLISVMVNGYALKNNNVKKQLLNQSMNNNTHKQSNVSHPNLTGVWVGACDDNTNEETSIEVLPIYEKDFYVVDDETYDINYPVTKSAGNSKSSFIETSVLKWSADGQQLILFVNSIITATNGDIYAYVDKTEHKLLDDKLVVTYATKMTESKFESDQPSSKKVCTLNKK